jgi:hypothetical protein
MTQQFDIAGAFLNKQAALEASYSAIRAATSHPGTKGDEAEADWIGLIRDFLPARYEVGPIFAVDYLGRSSDQIDVAVYDKQYSPQWFGTNRGVRFVPVESVYAVFEVKPTLNKTNIEYARAKVASVRTLKRTSAPIIHAGGKYKAADPDEKHIIGGVLTTRSEWNTDTTAANIDKHLPDVEDPGFLDIGIALDTITFDFTPDLSDGDDDRVVKSPAARFSESGNQLIYFAIRLFRQLQLIGTALAVDMRQYEQAIAVPVPRALGRPASVDR